MAPDAIKVGRHLMIMQWESGVPFMVGTPFKVKAKELPFLAISFLTDPTKIVTLDIRQCKLMKVSKKFINAIVQTCGLIQAPVAPQPTPNAMTFGWNQ